MGAARVAIVLVAVTAVANLVPVHERLAKQRFAGWSGRTKEHAVHAAKPKLSIQVLGMQQAGDGGDCGLGNVHLLPVVEIRVVVKRDSLTSGGVDHVAARQQRAV